MPWYREISRDEWRTLVAAQLGWMLDAMDVMLYSFALTAVKGEFQLSGAAAGALGALPLVTSAAGGMIFGWLSDRYGRARALVWSILAFSLLTACTAISRSVGELVFWRALVGIGLGGEWAAGSVLVAETWPEKHRGKAIGLMQSAWAIGYLLAAVMAAVVLPEWGWRPLFVLGVLPALVTLWIRRGVPEPANWQQPKHTIAGAAAGLFREPMRRNVLLMAALCSTLLFGYWGLFTWLPAYLASPVEKGGAGLGIVRSSAWIVPLQVGAFFGYISFGFFADRFGRRRAFLAFVLTTAVLVPVYGLLGRSAGLLLALGPLVGYFGHGYFSVLGAMAADLFPPELRTTAQGFCYNIGRALAGLAPVTVGAFSDRYGIGVALAFTAVFFVAGAGVMARMESGSLANKSTLRAS
ncbi:MAG TPA: MFS transporter [Candidatus Acidoferrales bacterium]|nr:MFS transporter [Candidatus Acidoferrales bacterium]